MSCQIRVTANLSDTTSIRRNLFQNDEQKVNEAWLQQCEVSVAPTGDIIVLAYKNRAVILTAKWNSSSSLSQFVVTFTGTVHDTDNITSVLCLPIVGQSQSSHVGPDWTCMMIGFESGYVRFYTEHCELLMEEQIHNENILSLKCQSQHNPRPDISPDIHPEEVYIHYASNMCVLPGSQLFPILRSCRAHLARVQAKGDSVDLSQTPLNPKKWGFQDQATILDGEVVGLNLTSTFDHLMTAAICGGFDAKYRAMPPNNNLVVAVGAKPFVGFHYALEGGVQPVLSDVAKAVASKLKSALPTWLSLGSKSQVEKQLTVAMQPSEPMGCRFGLCDLRRTGQKIILSPDHRLGAVSDALGRVMLIDIFRGVILRIFKGYRDAQCSFVQVPEEKRSKFRLGNRVALFLVIYSPKKGTIEIFTVQQGSKVTTFTASKFSKLLYINYGLMGYATTSKSRYICQFTTVFMDNDGQIKEILIPFHFALAERNNKRAKDIHLYKKLRQLIKAGEYDMETLMKEAYNTCTELKTMDIIAQTIELLINNKNIPAEVTLKCVEYITEKFKEDPVDGEASNGLRTLCENLRVLLNFYLFVTNSVDNSLDVENGNIDRTASEGTLLKDTKLSLGAKELSNLQKLLDLTTLNDNKKSPDLKVTFFDDEKFTASEFLSVFELNHQEGIKLKENLDESKMFQASEVIFKRYVTGCTADFDKLQEEVKNCKIFIKDIFKLLVHYWVNRLLEYDMNLEEEMNNLSCIIYTLAKAGNQEVVVVDYNCVSRFWSKIREILADAPRPFPALTAAILCRTIAQRLEKEKELQHSATSLEDTNIEILSQETCEWGIVIGKLEDVSLLNIILSNKPISTDCTLPVLTQDKVNISLQYILERGKGSVSEMVAKWLTLVGVNPESIVLNDHIHKNAHEEETAQNVSVSSKQTEKLHEEVDPLEQVPEEKIKRVKSQSVFNHLNLMKAQFPYNLEADRLLANMCWEYALAWQKEIQNLGMLEASMKCLRQIHNIHIQQGLHNLLWSTHFRILFESTSKLINKVGKLPKERLCRQDTGLADYQVTLFIEICSNFLDNFLDAVQKSYKIPKPELLYEPMFENGTAPLVELALKHSQINYDLLHLHYQLSLCLQMMTTFFIKQTKPVNNLFETSLIPLFFCDFEKQVPVNWEKSDTKLNFIRTQFLVKVISASLETVTVNENNEAYTKDHVKWMSKCLSIARMWDLDIDLLKRYQVVNLYANGFDAIGSELLPAVNELNKLGSELLAVAGKRLSQYMASCPNLAEKYPALSPLLSEYLETLNSGYYCAPSKLDDILVLSSHTLNCLEENQPEHKLAEHLLDACSTLIDLES